MVVVTTSILVMPLQYGGTLLLARRLVSLLPGGLGGSRVQPRQLQTRRNSLADTLTALRGCPFVIWAVARVSLCVFGPYLLHVSGACLEGARRSASYCSWLQYFLASCILIMSGTTDRNEAVLSVYSTLRSLVLKGCNRNCNTSQVMVFVTNNLLLPVRPFCKGFCTSRHCLECTLGACPCTDSSLLRCNLL